jgi:hypothetical protein
MKNISRRFDKNIGVNVHNSFMNFTKNALVFLQVARHRNYLFLKNQERESHEKSSDFYTCHVSKLDSNSTEPPHILLAFGECYV